MNATNALLLSPVDTVAVALADLPAGAIVEMGEDTRQSRLEVMEAVPMGHKVAVKAMAAGEAVFKYGVEIGTATRAIAVGQHVHVHNIASNRARSQP